MQTVQHDTCNFLHVISGESIHSSILSTNQSINQPLNYSVDKSVNQPIKKSISQSINQSINLWLQFRQIANGPVMTSDFIWYTDYDSLFYYPRPWW